jgi:hypothetical protein
MRRWLMVTVAALMVARPAIGYAQTPSGGTMKDDTMKMEKMEKEKKGGMVKGKMKDGTTVTKDKAKDRMMDKQDDKMGKK